MRDRCHYGRVLLARPAAVLVATALAVSGCGLLDRFGQGERRPAAQVGVASWYDPGRRTVRGVTYDSSDLTAAHRSLPFGTRARVTNLENGRSVVVVVNDRGPLVPGRVVDVSLPAARRLGIVRSGLARVRVEVIRRAPAAA